MTHGVGEGPPNVAEELGFEQFLGNRPAVDGDEHPVRPAAVVVKGPGDQLLAGAALAGDQHGAVGICDLLDHVEDTPQSRAGSDDVLEAVALVELALEDPVLGLEAAVFDGLFHEPSDHVQMGLVEGLLQVPEGARPQGVRVSSRHFRSR